MRERGALSPNIGYKVARLWALLRLFVCLMEAFGWTWRPNFNTHLVVLNCHTFWFGTVKDIMTICWIICVQVLTCFGNLQYYETPCLWALCCLAARHGTMYRKLNQDKSLWCNLLEGARTVPYDLICLELGVEPLCFIIIRKRLSYLQHILKQKESSLVRQFLMTQSINPRKKDWVSSIKEDLKQLEINLIFVQIEEMGKFT